MKQQLRKPENWQDFETLCKKLWGEIWHCPEIKKNGRVGQTQHGVDVFGIPQGESSYFGIQCKGKDDYINAQLSIKEIDEEVKKALLFSPKLKKFYIATTANKDSKIEEYIRNKNIESIANERFEIHLFCWEDIVELIDENKKTYDWYVRSINFATKHEVLLSFQDGSKILECEPVFKKVSIKYFDRSKLDIVIDKLFHSGPNRFGALDWRLSLNKEEFIKSVTEGVKDESEEDFNDPQPIQHETSFINATNYIIYNRSVCTVQLCLKNTGSEVLEKYKLIFEFEGAINIDTVNKRRFFLDSHPHKYDSLIKSEFQIEAKPLEDYLVQNDTICFDKVCFKPYAKDGEVKIYWKLISKDYEKNGELLIHVKPKFELSNEIIFIEDPGRQPEVVKIKNKYEYQNTDSYGKPTAY